MSILTILAVLVIIGLLLWTVNTYIPMDEKIKKIINIAVVIGVVLWLLKTVGACAYLGNIHI
jgi:hypothetical protein